MNKQQMEMDFNLGTLVFADLDKSYGFSDSEVFTVTKAFIEADGTHVYEVEKNGEFYEVYPASMVRVGLTDKNLENLWIELGDVLFDENENGNLVLSENWLHFEKGTDRETIWHWFDGNHSKGIYFLMNELEDSF